jgi:hypothetical protein
MKLHTKSNSTLASFNFTLTTTMPWAITLNATCGYDGFINMTIPRSWLDGPFALRINQTNWNCTLTQNSNDSIIYFDYPQGSHMIEITGSRGSIPGDLNGNGKVNLQDLVILAQNYGAEEYP